MDYLNPTWEEFYPIIERSWEGIKDFYKKNAKKTFAEISTPAIQAKCLEYWREQKLEYEGNLLPREVVAAYLLVKNTPEGEKIEEVQKINAVLWCYHVINLLLPEPQQIYNMLFKELRCELHAGPSKNPEKSFVETMREMRESNTMEDVMKMKINLPKTDWVGEFS